MTTTQLIARVRDLITSTITVTDSRIFSALQRATIEVSAQSPLSYYGTLQLAAGVGDLSDLEHWTDSPGDDLVATDHWSPASTVTAVEFPLDKVPASIISVQQWRQYAGETNQMLRIGSGATTETVGIHYSAPHVVQPLPADPADPQDDEDGTTFDVFQAEACALLAAAEIVDTWASTWAQKRAYSIAGEEYMGPNPNDARNLAKDLRDRARDVFYRSIIRVGYSPQSMESEDWV